MFRERKIAVVIPAYNEERLIAKTLESIPDYIDKVYAIDDGSIDKTSEIIGRFEDGQKYIHIKHEKNQGAGAAVVSGYNKALDDNIDITAVMDGDNQMSSEYLPMLLNPIIDGKADYTKGNRLHNSEYRKGMSNWRFFGNVILTFLTKISSGYWQLIDPQNGYTAISRNALMMLDLKKIYPRYGYLNDILMKLNIYNFRVISIPIPAKYGAEKSKIKYKSYILKVSGLLFNNFVYRLKMKYFVLAFHPLILFYALGMTLTPIGLLGESYALYYKYFLGGEFFIRGILALLILILGIQFLLFAMLFDMQAISIEYSDNYNLGRER